MIHPTTRHRRPFEPYTQAAAQIIADLATGGRDTVSRADIRRRWYRRYPQQGRSSGAGKGPVGSPRLKLAIRDLAERGIITRSPDQVRVLDRKRLAQVAHEDPDKKGG